MSKNTIAMIVEGTEYEPSIIENMDKVFFHNSSNSENIKLVSLPADQNIYMLYQRFKEYGDDIDIIEVIREFSPKTREALKEYSRNDFSEVYLFMDLDKQQNNLPKGIDPKSVVLEMLQTFNNETENGKLYISYPSAEAIGDYCYNSCIPISDYCLTNLCGKKYKNDVKKSKYYKDISEYTINDWNNVKEIYRQRLACLYGKTQKFTVKECKLIEPCDIYKKQLENKENKTHLLSAFPEFLIDYFNINKEGDIK